LVAPKGRGRIEKNYSDSARGKEKKQVRGAKGEVENRWESSVEERRKGPHLEPEVRGGKRRTSKIPIKRKRALSDEKKRGGAPVGLIPGPGQRDSSLWAGEYRFEKKKDRKETARPSLSN